MYTFNVVAVCMRYVAGVDFVTYYSTKFGMVRVTPEFFEFRVSSTSGHPFKLYKRYNSCGIRSLNFTERVINVWNKLPVSIVDFRTCHPLRSHLTAMVWYSRV